MSNTGASPSANDYERLADQLRYEGRPGNALIVLRLLDGYRQLTAERDALLANSQFYEYEVARANKAEAERDALLQLFTANQQRLPPDMQKILNEHRSEPLLTQTRNRAPE